MATIEVNYTSTLQVAHTSITISDNLSQEQLRAYYESMLDQVVPGVVNAAAAQQALVNADADGSSDAEPPADSNADSPTQS